MKVNLKKVNKKKEDESKFKKSEKISMRASLLENKLNLNNTNSDKKPVEKINEVNEDEKDN